MSAGKMLDIRGAAVAGGRVRATDGKLGKGRKRKRGGRVYLCAYMSNTVDVGSY